MSKNKIYLSALLLLFSFGASAQVMTLEAVLDTVKVSHPAIKMYESEIRAMDEAAKGARMWMPTQLGTGFFMTPL